MTLRPMRPEEAASFAAMEATDRPYPWTEGNFHGAMVAPSTVLVWEEEGRTNGYAAIQIVGSEAYLTNLMIVPSLRRRGLGSALLQKVMIWSRDNGALHVCLDVAAGNGPAIRLYERQGFLTLDRRARSYPRGEDALTMKKDL